MRKFYQILIVFLLIHFQANAQSDCVDAIVICGNSNFSGLTATGFEPKNLPLVMLVVFKKPIAFG